MGSIVPVHHFISGISAQQPQRTASRKEGTDLLTKRSVFDPRLAGH